MARILVVDDDEILNDMITQLLQTAGHDVQGAPNGKCGMELFNAKPFDLVITDIVMPEKEGIKTIFDIRKLNKTVPIIAISGIGCLGSKLYLPLAKQCGANYTIEKPFDNTQFLEVVKRCIYRDNTHNR